MKKRREDLIKERSKINSWEIVIEGNPGALPFKVSMYVYSNFPLPCHFSMYVCIIRSTPRIRDIHTYYISLCTTHSFFFRFQQDTQFWPKWKRLNQQNRLKLMLPVSSPFTYISIDYFAKDNLYEIFYYKFYSFPLIIRNNLIKYWSILYSRVNCQ